MLNGNVMRTKAIATFMYGSETHENVRKKTNINPAAFSINSLNVLGLITINKVITYQKSWHPKVTLITGGL